MFCLLISTAANVMNTAIARTFSPISIVPRYRIEKQVAPCHISNNIEHIQEEEDTTHECCVFMSFYKEFAY